MIVDKFKRQLEQNEFAFGTNTKTLLNFWTVLDKASKKMDAQEKRQLNNDYDTMGLCYKNTKPFLNDNYYRSRMENVFYISHFGSIGRQNVQLWCFWASLEIIFIQDLLKNGHSLIFLPKLIQQLEHYGAL